MPLHALLAHQAIPTPEKKGLCRDGRVRIYERHGQRDFQRIA